MGASRTGVYGNGKLAAVRAVRSSATWAVTLYRGMPAEVPSKVPKLLNVHPMVPPTHLL